MTTDDLDNRFRHHVPKEGQPEKYAHIRATLRGAAEEINTNCPESREKAIAITKLEEAMFWANGAIARNP